MFEDLVESILSSTLYGITDERWTPTGDFGRISTSVNLIFPHLSLTDTSYTFTAIDRAPSLDIAFVETRIDLSPTLDEIERSDRCVRSAASEDTANLLI